VISLSTILHLRRCCLLEAIWVSPTVCPRSLYFFFVAKRQCCMLEAISVPPAVFQRSLYSVWDVGGHIGALYHLLLRFFGAADIVVRCHCLFRCRCLMGDLTSHRPFLEGSCLSFLLFSYFCLRFCLRSFVVPTA